LCTWHFFSPSLFKWFFFNFVDMVQLMVKFRFFIQELWERKSLQILYECYNSTKFEVNWWRGSQFTARHMKNRNFTIKYTHRRTINSNNSVKFEVNWPRGSQVRAWHVKRTDGTDRRTFAKLSVPCWHAAINIALYLHVTIPKSLTHK
jgi:hypothetical protein